MHGSYQSRVLFFYQYNIVHISQAIRYAWLLVRSCLREHGEVGNVCDPFNAVEVTHLPKLP